MPPTHPITRTLRLGLATGSVLVANLAMAQVPDDAATRLAARQRAVADTERAFADTLARRDLDGFRRFLAPDAVFVDDATTLRGPDAIVAAWQDLFKAPQAPFSWRPDRVEVQADGVLALSTGPVSNAAGHVVGRFTSTWREATPGVWRIVLDIGSPACSTAPR